MSDEVVWQDPPPDGRVTTRQRREALKANPGRWILWAESASRAYATKLAKDGFEIRTRHLPGEPNHRCALYARWPEDVS
jgi:hypothetical protein